MPDPVEIEFDPAYAFTCPACGGRMFVEAVGYLGAPWIAAARSADELDSPLLCPPEVVLCTACQRNWEVVSPHDWLITMLSPEDGTEDE